jgi:hypothetical protein
LRPGEIRPEQEQHIAIENGVIAGWSTDDPSHADIVRVVVFEEVLATRRVGHGRLQSRRRRNHLVMRPCATGAGVDRDRFASVQNGCDLVEVRVIRSNAGTPRMNSIGRFVMRGGVGNVRRYDEHRYASFVSAA